MIRNTFDHATLVRVIRLGLLVASVAMPPAFAVDDATHSGAAAVAASRAVNVLSHRSKPVRFGRESASQDARHIAGWIVDSGDNHNLPFAIVDKTEAKVFVFHANGRLRGATPALLGSALGDDSAPGIGESRLSSIRPEERTTPAGRFVAALDRNLQGKEILWVDYDAAISLHPVVTSNVQERRAQRLATPTPLDNRISYGCINVSAEFFRRVVSPAFRGTNGIVYVLPETRAVQSAFASYDVAEHARLQLGAQIGANSTGRK